MSASIERVLSALRARGLHPKRSGSDWCCRCPAHDDRAPSLSIGTGRDGRTLLKCHAGCSAESVCEAIGLRWQDLFEPDPAALRQSASRRSVGREGRAGDTAAHSRVFESARDAVADLERRLGKRSRDWTYVNASGNEVGMVLRWDLPNGRKDVRPVSQARDGKGWVVGGMPSPRPLYALPDVMAASPAERVYVTEGEKAADAARAIGLIATTSAHGAEAASKADWSPLAGREVVILPDHDRPGERYADDVARLAAGVGAKSVRVVRLAEVWDGMPEGGDIADMVEHFEGDADSIKGQVESAASRAPDMVIESTGEHDAFVPFPLDTLPEPVRTFVSRASKAIGCDPCYVALPILAGLSAAIGNTRRIALKRNWSEPAIVWTAIVGESGTQKSPAMESALRAVRHRQEEAMKVYRAALQDHDGELALYERDLATWKRSKLACPPPVKPEPPTAKRYWTDDVTTEALARMLNENPRGLLLVKDELSGWFNFDRYAGGKGGDSAKWLEMFGGRPFVVDRKGSGTIHVRSAAVSIAGGIQPETLRRALGQEHFDNGLAARLLLSHPPRRPKRWTESDVDDRTTEAVSEVFGRLYELDFGIDANGDSRPVVMQLSDEAKREFVRFYDEHASEQVDLSGDEAAAWSKLEGYAARLALVTHLARWAGSEPGSVDCERVDRESIQAGVKLARWFGREARRVYAMLGEAETDRESRRLVDWIEAKGGCVTLRDLTRGPRAYRKDPEMARKALEELVAKGLAQWEWDATGPRGGRPADRVRLLAPHADRGDGDETPSRAASAHGSVTVASVATSSGKSEGWAEL
jgi:hypothetical protein